MPLAIGWTLEGKIAPTLYDHWASKDRLARTELLERMNAGTTSMPAAADIEAMVDNTHVSMADLTALYRGNPQEFIDTLPQGEAFDWLVALTGDKPAAMTELLYTSNNIGLVWYILGVVGVITAIGIWQYGRWILTLKTNDEQ